MSAPARPPGFIAFVRRAWTHRRELDGPQLRPEEAEFMPGTLELETAPPSPTATWVARLMMVCLLALAAWSVMGELDIVATAPSVVIAGPRNQVLGSPATTQVRAIHVREGSRVAAGDVLVELDATLPLHEGQDAREESASAARQLAVSTALLQALQSPSPRPAFALAAPALQMAEAAWAEQRARSERVGQELARVRESLAAATSEAAELRALHEEQLVSRLTWSEREQQRLQLEARVAALQGELAQNAAEFRRVHEEQAERARMALERARLAQAKATSLAGGYALRAPMAGTVHRLMVHTEGGVVSAAQPLLELVPEAAPLELEATVQNKDIGFVKVGQPVAVKLDAYDASRHGVLRGQVAYVSPDAVQEEQPGGGKLVGFKARVVIDRDSLPYPVTPGMTATADIRTGSRTLAAYLLSPLVRTVRDSLRER